MPLWFMASYVLMLVIGVGMGIWLYRRDSAVKKRKKVTPRRFLKREGEGEEL